MKLFIQSHRVLAQRYRKMARARYHKLLQEGDKNAAQDRAYQQLTECADEHGRKARICGKKRHTFIFMRGM